MANRNWASGGKIYSGHIQPVAIDCNFIVDSANGNGLGIRSLKGPYVQNVFMHTSSTPGAGNSNNASPSIPVINPNPASGTIVIQMMDAYNRVYTGGNSIVSPAGSSSGSVTSGVAYILTSLGTATSAQLHTAGIPKGVVPAVGVAFISSATGTLAGSATAAPTAAAGSGVATIETVGNTNLAIGPYPVATNTFGGQIIVQCRDYAGALVAPVDGSVISLSFLLSNSSVLVQGE